MITTILSGLLPILFVETETHQTTGSSASLFVADCAIRSLTEVVIETAIRGKIFSQHVLSFRLAEARHHGKALRANAVDDAEIQTLGKVALLFADLILSDIENLRRGHAVEIRAWIEAQLYKPQY